MSTLSINKKSLSVVILLFFVMVGLIIYFALFHKHTDDNNPLDCSKYPFINKTIDCTLIDTQYSHTKYLDSKIQKIIDEEQDAGHITQASVFYRDLNTRQWFGINENVNFYAASLLKLPISMVYFKLADIDEQLLNQKITIPKEEADVNLGQFFKPTHVFKNDTEYSIHELIRGMLIYSDNTPLVSLNTFINTSIRGEILKDLGIQFRENNFNEPIPEIDVKIYANILRQLYNSSYLNLEHSNTLLDYLSQTTFSEGIVAGVPKHTPVSHKFGQATLEDGYGGGRHILHDCGIIYRPDRPYIICIMTEGHDYSQLTNVIKRITEASYKL